MEVGDDMQLNITTETTYSRVKAPKLTKPQRMHIKRQERRQKLYGHDESSVKKTNDDKSITSDVPVVPKDEEKVSSNKSATTTTTTQNKTTAKKRKAESHETIGKDGKYIKKMKVSSIFTKNPDIPQINVADADITTEEIFSKTSFRDYNLHPFMVSNLEDKFGLSTVTTVQQMAIPHVLKGKDVLVKSQTGSGKTLSYAIPIVQKLQEHQPKVNRTDGPYALVLVPTRELALQSYNTFEKLLRSFTWIVPGVIMGGEKRKSEKARLRKGINILVATPGRLLDHLQNTNSLGTNCMKWLVIDEADRLLDMGFEKEVSKIVQLLDGQSASRQTVLLSATLSSGVERLAGMTLNSPAKIDIAAAESLMKEVKPNETAKPPPDDDVKEMEVFATPESLHHHYVIVPSKLRLVTLASFLLWKCKYSGKPTKIMVFLATQDSVEFHHKIFDQTINSVDDEDEDKDLDLFQLHGNMPQKDRTRVYNEFMEVPYGVLFCTDVASRGLHLPNVRWIVQYNTPGKATDYIHRVGRTARIGTKGNALLFITPEEVEYIKVLNQHKINMKEIEVNNILKTLQLYVHEMPKSKKFSGQVPNTTQECAMALQGQFEDFIAENKDMRALARKAYQSFIRSYATYPSNLKHIFHIKKLHMGHTATSFALQEAPKKIGSIIGYAGLMEQAKQKKTKKQEMPSTSQLRKKMKTDLASEYSSGLSKRHQTKLQKKISNL